MNNLLITGCCGFIGFHLTQKILITKKNINLFGIDNLNNYYDIKLKTERLKKLKTFKKFTFSKIDIKNEKKLENYFKKNKINRVVHLAAQAGVRFSIINPDEYFKNNIYGFYNILKISNKYKIKHLIFASTSSVYGNAKTFPLKEDMQTDKPESFYAASKKTNEILAYSFSAIHKLPSTGLRFFTVYGPYGRPDMSLFKFTKGIINSKKINLFNKGIHTRDFTYVDDVVNLISRIIYKPPKSKTPYEIFNISSTKPKKLKTFLSLIEKYLNKKASLKLLPLQKGDVIKTHGSSKKIIKKTNYSPKTQIDIGIKNFIDWYKKFYK